MWFKVLNYQMGSSDHHARLTLRRSEFVLVYSFCFARKEATDGPFKIISVTSSLQEQNQLLSSQ